MHLENSFTEEFLACTPGAQGTPQTVKWPCEPIILPIGHF